MAHHIPLRRLIKRRVVPVVYAALLTTAVLALAAGAKFSNAVTGGVPAAKASSAPPAASMREGPDEEVETEIVSILPTGFEPSRITRPRGKFRLLINNRSGIEEINWRLDRDSGGRLREVQLNREKLRSQQYEDLPPGTYFLSEAGHADWLCRITITPK